MTGLWSFIIVLFSLTFVIVNGVHFRYPDLNKNEEFPKWGGLCDSGKSQSPINLNIKGSKVFDFKPLRFVDYERRQSVAYIENNGHTVMISGFKTPMEVYGGPLSGKYQVEQLHFHWDSEHTIGNVRYPFEVHIVHRNKQYLSLKEAAAIPNGIFVLGLLYHYDKYPNTALNGILSALDSMNDPLKYNQPVKLNSVVTLSQFLPNFYDYYTYNGSLTTPSCDESVHWVVSMETFPIARRQVDFFKKIRAGDGEALTNNYRFVQNLNGRAVMISGTGGKSKTSIAAPLLIFLLTSFTILFLK